MPRRGDTLSNVKTKRRQVRRGAFLSLELECERPVAGPGRWGLTGLTRVRVNRGASRASHTTGPQELTIEVPDLWMSSGHLEISLENEGWTARDLGSKNGLVVDGERTEQASLGTGSLVLAGHTFFRFRSAVPLAGEVEDFDELREIDPLATLSPSFERVLTRARAAAPARVPVLIVGESGTGKEVLARTLHAMSGRRGALVAVNCGAIPPNLVEAELFGHKKGAFSGADADRPGLVKASDGGTLFLDEIGDLPLPAQAALLRVLQEAQVLPVGSVHPIRVDLRVVAATHRDLGRLVKEDRFRQDLLARLDGVTLLLPPLRERAEDLPFLIALLLRRLAPGRSDLSLAPDAAEALLEHSWPLNVRELEQALAGALALSGGGPIEVGHLPESMTGRPVTDERELTPEETRHREELLEHLRRHGGNVSAVARALGKHRNQIVRWLMRYQIEPRTLNEGS